MQSHDRDPKWVNALSTAKWADRLGWGGGSGGGGVSGNLWQIKPRDKTTAFSIVFINCSVVLLLLLQMTFDVQRALNIKNQSLYCLKGSQTDDAYIAGPVDKNGITNKHTAGPVDKNGITNKHTAGPVDKNGITNKHTAVFHSIFLFQILKNRHFKSAKTRSVSGSILFLTVRISDVTNKAGMCRKKKESQMRHVPAFVCSSLENSKIICLRPEEMKVKAQITNTPMYKYWRNDQMERITSLYASLWCMTI